MTIEPPNNFDNPPRLNEIIGDSYKSSENNGKAQGGLQSTKEKRIFRSEIVRKCANNFELKYIFGAILLFSL